MESDFIAATYRLHKYWFFFFPMEVIYSAFWWVLFWEKIDLCLDLFQEKVRMQPRLLFIFTDGHTNQVMLFEKKMSGISYWEELRISDLC